MKAKIIYPDKSNPNLKTFEVNGVQQYCPFKTTFIIPGQLAGQSPSVLQQPCQNSCPMFYEHQNQIVIGCGGTLVRINIDDEISISEPKTIYDLKI